MAEQYSEDDWQKLYDEIKKSVLRGFPNPERIGCPGADLLKQLAARKLPVDHPAYSHIMECSPCYQELTDIRAATPDPLAEPSTGLSIRRSSSRWVWPAAMVAILVVCAAVAYYTLSPHFPGVSSKQEVALNVDLQHWRVFRSETPGKQRGPLVFPRQRLDLTFSLPVGSEDGQYYVQIVNRADGPALVFAQGTAQLQDHTETLRTRLDVSSLPAGTYSLEIRRLGSGPLHVPIEITGQGAPP
jgi:hypothetical protein